MNTCKTCIYWGTDERDWDEIARPLHPVSNKPIDMFIEVRRCNHPKLLFCERPSEKNGFSVADGSEYFAALYTAEEFGCVRWEGESESSITVP